jgi:hypothetical protein
MDSEGDAAFATVREVQDTAAKYTAPIILRVTVQLFTTCHNMVSVGHKHSKLACHYRNVVVLLLTFKSLSLPLILLFTIEAAIYI